MKAYGSLAKRERMTRKTQRPPIPEKRRVLKDLQPRRQCRICLDTESKSRFSAGYGFDRQDRDSDSLDKNRWNARTTPSAIMGVGITAPANEILR